MPATHTLSPAINTTPPVISKIPRVIKTVVHQLQRLPTSPQSAINSSLPIALICTTRRDSGERQYKSHTYPAPGSIGYQRENSMFITFPLRALPTETKVES